MTGDAVQSGRRQHDRVAAGAGRRGAHEAGVGALGDQAHEVAARPVDDLSDLVGVGGQDHGAGVTAHTPPGHDVGFDLDRVGADRGVAQRGGQLVQCCS